MLTLAERLKTALDRSGQSQAALAKACKVSQPSVSDWLSGATKSMKSDSYARAAAFLGCSRNWLEYGTGPFDPEPTTTPSFAVQERPQSYTPTTEQILAAMGQLLAGVQPDHREAVAVNLAAWAREGGATHYQEMLASLLRSQRSKHQAAA